MHRYFIINKPYNMVSQFVSTDEVNLLGSLNFTFPEGTHAIGRLDNHSEGLLILTTNKKVTKLLFQGKQPHTRNYLVRVKNNVSLQALLQLQTGIAITAKAGNTYTTQPCDVEIVQPPNNLFQSQNKQRDDVPHTWLSITLTEGKFHQIRKMVAAIHHRCQRLIRMRIEDLSLDNLQAGDVKEIAEEDFFKLLKIDDWRE